MSTKHPILRSLIPTIHQEFVLVIFLLIPYVLLQLHFTQRDFTLLLSACFLLMVIWLVKVFLQSDTATAQYKGFIALVTGLSLLVTGMYAALVYYLDTAIYLADSIIPFLYLFFPVWIMLEGIFMLFLLGFNSSEKTIHLEDKIIATKPAVGDFVMVALATVVLIALGELVLELQWYMNVCLVYAVNLVIINQFSSN